MEDKVKPFLISTRCRRPCNPGDTLKLGNRHGRPLQRVSKFRALAAEIVYNGTFFDLGIFPSFGYPGDPMTSDKDRKKYGLPKKDYVAPPQTDPWGLSNLLFNDDADYVTFEARLKH